MKGLELIVKICMGVKPGQQVLIITDDYARSIKISQQVAELCDLEGAEPVITIMESRTHYGHEPPRAIAEAMQVVDIIFYVAETYDITHTDAAKRAREMGIKSVLSIAHISEDYFQREISVDDLNRIKERTEHLAEIESRAEEARITSPYGTDIRMSLKGRKGLPLHPLSGGPLIVVPDYAEAAISPVEGSTEGVLVVDSSVQGWNFLLREPLKLAVERGRITEAAGPEDYVERLKKLLATDENASNCAAELGISASHTIPNLMGGVWDYGMAGTIHIAAGRNNDIGGETFSEIHVDFLLTKSTVWFDDVCVLENGELKI
jgi:leucyl aminopeptidase (aminopeptidase T)